MPKYLFIFILSFIPISLVGQVFVADSIMVAGQLDSLKKAYPCVAYSGAFAVSFYHAISAYPQLADAKIEFQERHIKTTMQCRPKALSVFGSLTKRRFLMVQSKADVPSHGMAVQNLSYQARVGLYSHELAHVIDYRRMSAWQIIAMGANYITAQGKQEVEHRIDRIVIWMGMGEYLYQFSTEVINSKSISGNYRKRRNRFYMKPADIKELVGIVENNDENVPR